MPMNPKTLSKPVRNGVQVSLYLAPEIRDGGRKLAKTRYDESLSDLVERLLTAEMSRKRGVRMARNSQAAS